MKTKFIIFFLILSTFFYCKEEKVKKQKKMVFRLYSPYQRKDFIIKNNEIWLLQETCKISIFNLENGDEIKLKLNDRFPISTITKDLNENIVVSDTLNQIYIYDFPKNNWIKIYKSENKVYGITFDKNNDCFLITESGIIDLKYNIRYAPPYKFNVELKDTVKWYQKPCYTIDKQNNIWIGFDYGEWGGDLYIFDTKKKKFLSKLRGKLNFSLTPITSIVQADNRIYVASVHTSYHVEIFQIENYSCKKLFNSVILRNKKNNSKEKEIEFSGAIDFYKKENCLYFFSDKGIFKCYVNNDLSLPENWIKIIQPPPKPKEKKNDFVLYNMYKSKLKVVNSKKIIFITGYDDLGMYNGTDIIFMK